MAAVGSATQTGGISATLAASTADTVTIAPAADVLVENRGMDVLWVTLGLDGASPTAATVAGAGCYCVQAGGAKVLNAQRAGGREIQKLSIISASATPYTVEGY